mmetsp:Transcript_46429/g.135241  ORF Transcript_46429/g.135241 Transcript_46429/m.135241 type:complete len:401 (+) Transcript_46429:1732-2934(+)
MCRICGQFPAPRTMPLLSREATRRCRYTSTFRRTLRWSGRRPVPRKRMRPRPELSRPLTPSVAQRARQRNSQRGRRICLSATGRSSATTRRRPRLRQLTLLISLMLLIGRSDQTHHAGMRARRGVLGGAAMPASTSWPAPHWALAPAPPTRSAVWESTELPLASRGRSHPVMWSRRRVQRRSAAVLARPEPTSTRRHAEPATAAPCRPATPKQGPPRRLFLPAQPTTPMPTPTTRPAKRSRPPRPRRPTVRPTRSERPTPTPSIRLTRRIHQRCLTPTRWPAPPTVMTTHRMRPTPPTSENRPTWSMPPPQPSRTRPMPMMAALLPTAPSPPTPTPTTHLAQTAPTRPPPAPRMLILPTPMMRPMPPMPPGPLGAPTAATRPVASTPAPKVFAGRAKLLR